MAVLLAAKEKEVEALQVKLMAQEDLIQVMNEDKQATASRLHTWLLEMGSRSSIKPANNLVGDRLQQRSVDSYGWQPWNKCLNASDKYSTHDEEPQADVFAEEAVRDAVSKLLLERESLLRSLRGKDETIASLEAEMRSLETRMYALKQASIEALEKRDEAIQSLRDADTERRVAIAAQERELRAQHAQKAQSEERGR